MKAPATWTKGDVHDTLTMGRGPTMKRQAVTWTVGGVTVTVKPCNDGRGGYWIKEATTARLAWVPRLESCFDAEGIAYFLRGEDAQRHKFWTFDRQGNAKRYAA